MKRYLSPKLYLLFGLLLLMMVFYQGISPHPPQAAADEPTRTVFVHLFEWRWADIADECENWLGPKGFAAVQVSPPQEHRLIDASESGDGTNYPWWQRYQPVSYIIQSRSGSRAEFANMVQRCNAVGVDIYVDAVINHMSGLPGGACDTGSAGTTICESNNVANYPQTAGGYSLADFHMDPTSANYCNHTISNWNNAWEVQHCELLTLDDLDTGESYVRNEIAAYLNDLVTNLGVAGFRVDAAKHMHPNDLSAIMNLVSGTPYTFQEVIQDSLTDGSNYTFIGDVTEFRYGQEIGNRFRYGPIRALQGLENWWLPSIDAVVFTDNHDNQRGHGGGGAVITHDDPDLYRLANVFMLAYPYGYPKVMSSYSFSTDGQGPPSDGSGNTNPIWVGGQPTGCSSGWVCEHRWPEIANMVAFRNETAANFYVTNWWDNGNNQVAFGRGDAGFVVINREGGTLSRTYQTSMPAGIYCDVIDGEVTPSGSCTGSTITVNGDGTAAITVSGMDAAAIHAGAVCTTGCGGGGYAKTYNQVYFRGTPNGWGTTLMTLVANYTWEIEATFGAGGSERFKFDVYGDWSLNFGDNNGDGTADQGGADIYITQGAGTYTITFNDQTKAYTVVKNGGGCGTVATTFNVYATTNWGQNVYVVGNIPQLGSWDPFSGVALSSAAYPTWSGTVTLPGTTTIQYKYVKIDGGTVTWEGGGNRSLTTPCGGTHATSDTWN